ncbi:site-specific integrase [Roseomonas genomospecies 6]|nr:site-specific integrase [Roseomonas genomospecies 6]
MSGIDNMHEGDALIPLPQIATARDGAEFPLEEEQWIVADISGHHYFTFWSLRELASALLIESLKRVTLHYIQVNSQSIAGLVFERFAAFLRFVGRETPVDSISVEHVLSYRTTLNSDTEWYLGVLRGFFRTWSDLGLPGVDREVVSLLKEMRLKGNPKGKAVKTADPLKGAFSDIEYEGIIDSLNNEFAKRNISVEDYLLVWLYLALGARSVQLAALKVSDLSVVRASSGAETHILKVPRAKQRGQASRTEFKNKKILFDVGRIIEEHCRASRVRWSSLGLRDEMIPFFVNPRNVGGSEDLRYHCSSRDLAKRVRDVFDLLNVTSERTGKKLNVTTRRFRYTIGTRAAKEGASELVIAEILDHSDT